MSNIVSIIGSFKKKKHYDVIMKNVNYLLNNGFCVQTPKKSKNVDYKDNGCFAVFDYDDVSLESWGIQMVTLEKIIKSDGVFVCNIGGYIGKTTSYEIGFCYSRGVPLYFLEKPIDLPVYVPEDHIVSIQEFARILDDDLEESMVKSVGNSDVVRAIKNIWPSDQIVSSKKKNRLMICGSMAFWDQMNDLKNNLTQKGIDVIIPKEENNLPVDMDEISFLDFKRRVSNSYLKKIRDGATSSILVFNKEKKGKANYIGANTFVEIAMAFAWNRKIYLLNDIYDQYRDELLSWNCIPLHGNLEKLISEYKNIENQYEKNIQLSIFDMSN